MSTNSPVPYGSAHTGPDGRAHTIHFELRLPHPLESAWAAVATPGGLRGWLAAADPFEPGPGGAVALRWLNGDGPAVPGRITAWERRRCAEYTVGARGSFGFVLEADEGRDGGETTRVRFGNDFDDDVDDVGDVGGVCVADDAGNADDAANGARGADAGGAGAVAEGPVARLALWHRHFELLHGALQGRPATPAAWAPARLAELRAAYARRAAGEG
ncbi:MULTISPECIES: hypothetical protein [Streptomyces]|uniref:hypothetical protein n=1 Tax=Streptomyces TaxID=1883 RepID=UPI0004C9D22A|nr:MULTISPECIES: hypothetical protein [Streptomyces]